MNNDQKAIIIKEVKSFSRDFPYFNGHFENDPILPGIIQIRVVSDAVISKFSKFTLAEVVKTKFYLPVRAEEDITLNIKLSFTDEHNIKCDAELSTDNGTASVMQLHYFTRDSAP